MTETEYSDLQARLTNLIEKAKFKYNGRNKEQVYTEGVLAAKSVLHEVFKRQQKVGVQK